MSLVEQHESRDDHDEYAKPGSQHRLNSHHGAKLPLPARVGLVLFGLGFVALALVVPEGWTSELVWALLFAGCVLWEAVGVFKEKSWGQEPLTRLYRDRLMKLPGWGKLFRIGFLFLFVWWLAHWLLQGF